jgi:hypothetical protein
MRVSYNSSYNIIDIIYVDIYESRPRDEPVEGLPNLLSIDSVRSNIIYLENDRDFNIKCY